MSYGRCQPLPPYRNRATCERPCPRGSTKITKSSEQYEKSQFWVFSGSLIRWVCLRKVILLQFFRFAHVCRSLCIFSNFWGWVLGHLVKRTPLPWFWMILVALMIDSMVVCTMKIQTCLKIWCHSGGDRHSLGGFCYPSPKGVSLDTFWHYFVEQNTNPLEDTRYTLAPSLGKRWTEPGIIKTTRVVPTIDNMILCELPPGSFTQNVGYRRNTPQKLNLDT